jgi:hypothetical protein
MARYGVVVPRDLQELGGPKYLVGIVSTYALSRGDGIEFGPLAMNAVAIKIKSPVLQSWAIGAFTRQDTQDIIDGLTQILADNPEIT